jgi:hypothetical protein
MLSLMLHCPYALRNQKHQLVQRTRSAAAPLASICLLLQTASPDRLLGCPTVPKTQQTAVCTARHCWAHLLLLLLPTLLLSHLGTLWCRSAWKPAAGMPCTAHGLSGRPRHPAKGNAIAFSKLVVKDDGDCRTAVRTAVPIAAERVAKR